MRLFFIFLISIVVLSCSEKEYTESFIPTPDTMFLLDFDGHKLEHTEWSSKKLDLPHSGLNKSQQRRIIDSIIIDFGEVARQYGIYIGSEEDVYVRVNPKRRIRVVITEDNSWYGNHTGVAATNTFGKDIPCFVFTKALHYSEHMVHRTITHEIGHVLGNRHEKKENGELNSGDGFKAPHMGNSFGKPVAYWTQENISVIKNNLKK